MEKGSVRIFVWANVIWFLIIFVLCAFPGEDIPDPRLNIPHLDKVVHFGMFFIFSLLLICPLERRTSLGLGMIYGMAIGVAAVYGGSLEVLQHFFFERSGDILDFVADVLGGAAGCLCYPLVRRIFR